MDKQAKEIADDVQQTYDNVSCQYRQVLEDRIKGYGKEKKKDGARSFSKLVKQMRKSQTRYFQNHSPQNLKEAKKLEGQVDRAVAAVLGERV